MLVLHERGKRDTKPTAQIDRELSRFALRVKTFQVQDEGKYRRPSQWHPEVRPSLVFRAQASLHGRRKYNFVRCLVNAVC